jgi:hypothetical protein
MKIRDIKTYLVGNPWKNWLFVQVETDEGVHGIGEGTLGHLSRTVEAAIHELKPLILGLEVFQIEMMLRRLGRDIYSDGGQIQMCAVSAIEIACWDIIGKALGQPIYNLLGGRCHKKIRAHPNGWYRCPRTPEDFAKAAKEVVRLGYTAMKFDPFGTARPQLVGDPHLSHANKNDYLNEYFNVSAFAIPCPVALSSSGTCPVPALGNFGRNVLIGPGYADWDVGLFKDTNVTERTKIQFRSEFFDVFNRANFSNPDSYMPDSTFGVISSAGPGRTIQLSLKLIF